jgi:hypothetical protein
MVEWALSKTLEHEEQYITLHKTELPRNVAKQTNTVNCTRCGLLNDHKMVVRYRHCASEECDVKFKAVKCSRGTNILFFQQSKHKIDCKPKEKRHGLLPEVRSLIASEFEKFQIQPKQMHAFITTKTYSSRCVTKVEPSTRFNKSQSSQVLRFQSYSWRRRVHR